MKMDCRQAALLFAFGLIGAGCTHAQARVEIPPPALDVPAPPPRVIETTAAEVPQPVGLAGDPADAARPAPPPAAAAASSRPAGASRTPEPPKPETPPAAEAVKPDEPRPTPALRAAPTQQEAALERSIRDRMFRASTVLDRIEARVPLNADARDQFNRARSFIREADDALRERNFTFAGSLADKAVAIAAQLGGR
jgi:hypothetical protein